jgi:hypothetical protein
MKNFRNDPELLANTNAGIRSLAAIDNNQKYIQEKGNRSLYYQLDETISK